MASSPGVAISPDGELAAGIGDASDSEAVVVWKTATWEQIHVIEPEKMNVDCNPEILTDGRILSSWNSGLWMSDPSTGNDELLYESKGGVGHLAVSSDETRVVLTKYDDPTWESPGRVILYDLQQKSAIQLETHGDRVWPVDLDPTGTMVISGDKDGILRVGPATGEEPHLLLGHEGWIWDIDIDPQGRWIASAGEDGTVRLWPMPDLSKPPLHALPRGELIAKLKTLTNLRVVRDEESPSGWKLTHDPFPGWETVPEW
jgi:WD40 repeat protein